MKLGGCTELTDEQCFYILDKIGRDDLQAEITANGIGQEFHKCFVQDQTVNAAEFIRWQFTETQGNNALDHLEPMFKHSEILEHYGNSWKLRVSRDKYSIGFLFGTLEDIKKEFDISEYSVTQTTLE